MIIPSQIRQAGEGLGVKQIGESEDF